MLKDRLKEARVSRGLTQSDVAIKMNITNSTISSYETGRSEPNMLQLTQLMEILGVDANFLLQDEMASDENVIELQLAPDETELVDLFRGLNHKGQDFVLAAARSASANPEMKRGSSTSETA